MVNNNDELTKEMLDILGNDERRAQMGAASLQVIKENRGADVRSIHYLKELLDLTAVPAREYKSYPINTRNLTDEGGGRCVTVMRLSNMLCRLPMVRKLRSSAGCYWQFCVACLIYTNSAFAASCLCIIAACCTEKN